MLYPLSYGGAAQTVAQAQRMGVAGRIRHRRRLPD
jgi:hypothetical protein